MYDRSEYAPLRHSSLKYSTYIHKNISNTILHVFSLKSLIYEFFTYEPHLTHRTQIHKIYIPCLIRKRSYVQGSTSNEAVRHGGLTIIVPRPTNILSIRDRSEQCVILERFATNVSRGRAWSVGHLNLLLAPLPAMIAVLYLL